MRNNKLHLCDFMNNVIKVSSIARTFHSTFSYGNIFQTFMETIINSDEVYVVFVC